MADIPVPSPKAKLFLLTTPNSPYGVAFPTAWVERLLDRFNGIVVADEAYVDFAEESSLPLLAAHPRLVIARTLSKAYSLAGMRAGLAFAHEELIREMMKVKDSYNVSRLAQVAACAALEDQEHFRTIAGQDRRHAGALFERPWRRPRLHGAAVRRRTSCSPCRRAASPRERCTRGSSPGASSCGTGRPASFRTGCASASAPTPRWTALARAMEEVRRADQ